MAPWAAASAGPRAWPSPRSATARSPSWAEFAVGWGDLHDTGAEGTHHARIVRFMREHAVESVVTSGLGEGMRTTMGKLGVVVRTELRGDARAAAVLAATTTPLRMP